MPLFYTTIWLNIYFLIKTFKYNFTGKLIIKHLICIKGLELNLSCFKIKFVSASGMIFLNLRNLNSINCKCRLYDLSWIASKFGGHECIRL